MTVNSVTCLTENLTKDSAVILSVNVSDCNGNTSGQEKYTVEYEVKDSKGNTYPVENNAFTPAKYGIYTVSVWAEYGDARSNIADNKSNYNPNGKDSAIDDWYLKWLDLSLANLRRNGGSCIIRACYALNGESNAEPSNFSLVEKHQNQLSEVFSKYSHVIVGVECGMAGQYGEMHNGNIPMKPTREKFSITG